MANQALPAKTSGQVHRVASRFAITGEALEIATEARLTGFAPGEARDILHRCLKQWVETNGLTNREETQLVEQVEHWFSTHGSSPRFIDWDQAKKSITTNPDGHSEPMSINCAGWRRRSNGISEYFVYPGVFKDELATGFNHSYAAKVLGAAGFIKITGKEPTMPVTFPTGDKKRAYRFVKTDRSEGE
jgi:putative DNA primase/helicase